MKLRNAAIAAALSLIPLGQPLVIGGSVALTSAAVMFSVPQRVNAESALMLLSVRILKIRGSDSASSPGRKLRKPTHKNNQI